MIINTFKKQQIELIKNFIIKKQAMRIANHNKKNTNNQKIKINQNKIKKIFDLNNKINSDPKQIFFELKKYNFQKGDYVYAFVLDNNEENQKPFQEGIVSKDYNENQMYFLPISIKGKNNKIFFNKDGDLIGISLPTQNKKSEVNYIITSNLIFHLINCFLWHNHNIDLFQINPEMNQQTKYCISLTIKEAEKNQNEQKTEKLDICLNQQGFFIGLKMGDKFLSKSQIFQKYSLCLECLEKLTNSDNDNQNNINKENVVFLNNNLTQNETQNNLNEIDQQLFSSSEENYEKKLKEKIQDLSKITFLVYLKRSLGSGFIYKTEKSFLDNKYRYYMLTNRHVIETDQKNNNILIFNKYFTVQKVKSLLFIENKKDYDDLAILTFEEEINPENEEKFEKVNKILDYAFPKDKNVDIIQGDEVYSMGSQVSILPSINLLLKPTEYDFNILEKYLNKELYNKMIELYTRENIKKKIEKNLLKKGHIISFNDKIITFNITIDDGNSGGPVFNKKGQIVGINRSTIQHSLIVDYFSQSININHIQKILDENYWKENEYFKQKKIDFLKKEMLDFKDILQKNVYSNEKNPKFTIFIDELLFLFMEKKKNISHDRDHYQFNPIVLFSTPIIKNKTNELKIMINFFKKLDLPEQIFYFDPSKEIVKLELNIEKNNNNNQFLLKIIKENEQNVILESKKFYFELEKDLKEEFLFKDIRDINYFLSFELYHFIPQNQINSQEKIKKSLVVWYKEDDDIEGNGIIFHKEKLSNGNFLYYVLSNYNGYVSILDELKNILFDQTEIITYKSNIYEKEKIKINSFYSNNMNNLVLMSFESDYEYDVAQITPNSEISTGDEIYFLTNFNNENYFPQIFKSNIGNILEEKKSFLFDSVFDLKEKTTLKYFQLNFLCFDKEGNFIGFNDHIKYKNNKFIPSHFIQGSFLKNENLLHLFSKSILKEKFNIVFTNIFIFIYFYILLKKIPNNSKIKNEIN
ncbi:S1 family peptidase ['Cynodon dactylon' phytoplasma]|uniref:S1 family peptidase n=1 Tax='Cynodon dactylon' phytoplasma TaxID=295320 RepID=UPI001BAC2A10|nr:serine protease ['Cynodon dactylon' phytoplasma]